MRDGLVRSIIMAGAVLASPVGAAAAQADPAAAAPQPAPGETTSCVSATPGEDEPVVFPGTGKVFTLPPSGDEPSTPSCERAVPVLPVRPPAPDIFGAAALAVGDSMVNAQWFAAKDASLAGVPGRWSELLAQANALTHGEPLEMVNRWVNWNVRYVDDVGGDHWAPAAETLRTGQGDCEDFAIAKLALLEQLGVPADDMFLVLVRERQRAQDHAVLVVRRHGEMLVLDNRTDAVLPASRVTDYAPRMSFSGTFAWTYGYRAEGSANTLNPASAAR